MNIQDQLKYISSYTSKLLRQTFGRGPESCFAATADHYLVMNIRGFISPLEDVLLQNGKSADVDRTRNTIIKSLMNELRGVIHVTMDAEVQSFYHDWNFPNNRGVIILELDKILIPSEVNSTINYGAVEKEVARISNLVQKVPEAIHISQITPKILIVKRSGILVPIEKALLQKGFKDELYVTKDDLEKMYFHKDGNFDEILGQAVTDIFIDWHFEQDNSLMCFILKQ
ncbi:Na-translocating system protein MpsC family protein [Litchfieldia salsa]|uniref:Uncharacterized protein YbcI n=1 Tax=Litchfieldia salsa TaxID=930152 RepID=A0A1H0WKT4_9BACI|nr:Na-translocating system protein MpsC family protein [Litchfieldia salsa]SDP91267.1 Uncharacterized protein YbcI [Litchfieldia salsa]